MTKSVSMLAFVAAMAFATPAISAPGAQQSVSQDTLVVMSHWTVRMPFTPAADDPLTIGTVIDPMWGWIKEGGRIISVNGMDIGHMNALPAVLRLSTDLGTQTQLPVKLGTGRNDEGELVEELVILPIVQDTVIKNGMKFETVFDGTTWVSTVVAVPGNSTTDLQVGDRLVAYQNKPFDMRTSVQDIFQIERRKGMMDFAVLVERDGIVTDGTISLETPDVSDQIASRGSSRNLSNIVVLSHWSVRVPMEADASDGTMIGKNTDQLNKGDRVVSVNGIDVGSVNAVPAVIRLSMEPGDHTALDVELGVISPDNNTRMVRMISLPIVQDTVLGNGLRFETTFSGNVWATTLTAVPEDAKTDLKVGDRILAYEGAPFNMRTSLSDIFEAERRAGKDTFEVFVMRDGDFMLCNLAY